jgi:fatty acid desaturase
VENGFQSSVLKGNYMSSLYAETYMRAIKDVNLKKSLISISKERRIFPSVAAVVVILLFTALGIELASMPHFFSIFSAIVLIALAKICAWYLSHDCAHNCAFRSKLANSTIGECLSFLNGLSFFSFEDYRKDHVRHHAEKIDIGGFDSRGFAEAYPKLFSTISLIEKAYVPVFYYLIKVVGIYEAVRSDKRRESIRAIFGIFIYAVVLVAFARSSLLLILTWQFSSYIRIHVVRFVDCFQHSFDQVYPKGQKLSHDKIYEIQNTFSVPVARKFKLFNLIILNFGYHTAHHCFPSCPWYMLPKLDAVIMKQFKNYGILEVREESCSLRNLIAAYHRGRTLRLISDDEGHAYNAEGKFSIHDFTGAYTDKLLG